MPVPNRADSPLAYARGLREFLRRNLLEHGVQQIQSLARLVTDSGQRVGEAARDFSLPDSSGNLVSLSNYRGKIIFLNFWATWCGACRGEMASLESLYREIQGPKRF